MRYETIKDAAYGWVREFSAFPEGMIAKLMEADELSWHEVTPPSAGDRVYVFNAPDGPNNSEGYIKSYSEKTAKYRIELDSGKVIYREDSDFEVQYDEWLPMWGTLWQFKDSADDWWLEEDDGIRKMADCGFRIYEHEEWGYFFGIDGAGYDFYDAHWIPLYKARGLKWADEQYEEETA